ncbi:MAG: peroxiredoxin [Candidatus Polarisedimenticolia bacterium]
MSLVGNPAPDFAVQGYFNGEFKQYKLSDYKGKWVVLLFYPLDFTFVCPTEVLKFHDMSPKFNEKNCQIFGISVDSHFSHKAWVETGKAEGGLGGKLSYPLLADINKTMARNYDVLIENAGVALRGLFIIDPDGVVRHATINHLPVGRSAREALRVLTGFQFVREHGDQVCPADWEEGQETMAANPQGMRDFLKKR